VHVLAIASSAPAATSQAAGGLWDWMLPVLNTYAPLLQALFTFLLVAVTIVYVVFTRRLAKSALELHEKEVRERQHRARECIRSELREILYKGNMLGTTEDCVPVRLPTVCWETLRGEWSDLSPTRFQEITGIYVLVEQCNVLSELWVRAADKLALVRSREDLGRNWVEFMKPLAAQVKGVLGQLPR